MLDAGEPWELLECCLFSFKDSSIAKKKYKIISSVKTIRILNFYLLPLARSWSSLEAADDAVPPECFGWQRNNEYKTFNT